MSWDYAGRCRRARTSWCGRNGPWWSLRRFGRLTAGPLGSTSWAPSTSSPRRSGIRPRRHRTRLDVDDRDLQPTGRRVTTWCLYTSGTTGEPKPIDHSLASLTRTIRRLPSRPPRRARRWGLLYEPTRMAGVQVVLQALVAGESLLDATGLPRDCLTGCCGCVSMRSIRCRRHRRCGARFCRAMHCTPTTLTKSRSVVRSPISACWTRCMWLSRPPASRTCSPRPKRARQLAVGDGQEGFPRSYLESSPRGIGLDVRDGVLYVHAPGSGIAGSDGFVSTRGRRRG